MKTPEEEREHGTADDGQRAEELFTRVQEAQGEFWDLLRELEEETGIEEIDGTRDLNDLTLDDLYSEESESESACTCEDPAHIHPDRF